MISIFFIWTFKIPFVFLNRKLLNPFMSVYILLILFTFFIQWWIWYLSFNFIFGAILCCHGFFFSFLIIFQLHQRINKSNKFIIILNTLILTFNLSQINICWCIFGYKCTFMNSFGLPLEIVIKLIITLKRNRRRPITRKILKHKNNLTLRISIPVLTT